MKPEYIFPLLLLTTIIDLVLSKITIDGVKMFTSSECFRECKYNEAPRICYYSFTVEFYSVLSRACQVCTPLSNNSLTNECQCVLADGVHRTIMSVNRQIPGPTIYVCKNDKVIIDVKNLAIGNEITIHWHGILQKNSQYYDGVPFVTQCPIHEGNTFRYQWIADKAGTYFWHGHTGLHKLDGLSGSIIIREPLEDDIHSQLYDFDEFDHRIELTDWSHELAIEVYPGYLGFGAGQQPSSILINGRGQTINPRTQKQTNISLEIFNVTPGSRYRFRLINAFGFPCVALLTVESHLLTVIATDGEPIKPIIVNSIVSSSGERYDFIIDANQNPGVYWIQVRAIGLSCSDNRLQQLAILCYGTNCQQPKTPRPTYDEGLTAGYTLNAMNNSCDGKNSNEICIDQLENAETVPSNICKSKPTTKIDVGFRFKVYTDYKKLFQPDTYTPFILVTANGLLEASLLNNITFQFPTSPLISQRKDVNPNTICNATSRPLSCQNDDCHCTQIVEIPKNSLVELYVVDEKGATNLNHPFHLHGYTFYVIAMGTFPKNVKITSLEYLHGLDRQNKIQRCLNPLPPKKDTIQIPNNGYAIIRFVADNPGYWFLHCHSTIHLLTGMGMILHVAGDLPPVPPNFPKCGDFTNNINENPQII